MKACSQPAPCVCTDAAGVRREVCLGPPREFKPDISPCPPQIHSPLTLQTFLLQLCEASGKKQNPGVMSEAGGSAHPTPPFPSQLRGRVAFRAPPTPREGGRGAAAGACGWSPTLTPRPSALPPRPAPAGGARGGPVAGGGRRENGGGGGGGGGGRGRHRR